MRASEPDPGALFLGVDLAVILAAGRGHRLDPLTRRQPKPLLPVLEQSLFEWQLAALAACGVREVVVVIGHLGEALEARGGDGRTFGLALEYVRQPEPRGIAAALACAGPRLARPFLCLLGDVYFEASDLARLGPRLAGADAVLAVRAVQDPREVARNFSVEFDAQERVIAVEEKPQVPRGPWKGVGLYAFRPEFLARARATPPSSLRGECELTEAIAAELRSGAHVRAVPCVGRDVNLSTPADLLEANLVALARRGLTTYVAASAHVGAGAQLERAVVLSRAVVADGARLERALVMPGERVPAGHHADVVFGAGVRVPARE